MARVERETRKGIRCRALRAVSLMPYSSVLLNAPVNQATLGCSSVSYRKPQLFAFPLIIFRTTGETRKETNFLIALFSHILEKMPEICFNFALSGLFPADIYIIMDENVRFCLIGCPQIRGGYQGQMPKKSGSRGSHHTTRQNRPPPSGTGKNLPPGRITATG